MLAILQAGVICLDEETRGATMAQCGGNSLSHCGAATCECNCGPFRGEQDSSGFADARSRTGNDCNLAS